jgi:hypothetical protein
MDDNLVKWPEVPTGVIIAVLSGLFLATVFWARKKIVWFFSRILISPIRIDVRRFYYQSMENRPTDSVIVFTSHPSRYRGELRLTNRTKSIVYIKDIVVTINHHHKYKYYQSKEKIRFEPREFADYDIIFPVSGDEIPDKEGIYNLEVVPTNGRKTCEIGNFPL